MQQPAFDKTEKAENPNFSRDNIPNRWETPLRCQKESKRGNGWMELKLALMFGFLHGVWGCGEDQMHSKTQSVLSIYGLPTVVLCPYLVNWIVNGRGWFLKGLLVP